MTATINTPKWISDEGHAWLMVTEDSYRKSGYVSSEFSYRYAGYVWLEEDCDAGGYCRALGITPEQARAFPDVQVSRDTAASPASVLSPAVRMSGRGYVSPFAS